MHHRFNLVKFVREILELAFIIAALVLYFKYSKVVYDKFILKPKAPSEISLEKEVFLKQGAYEKEEAEEEASEALVGALRRSVDLFYTLNGRYPYAFYELLDVKFMGNVPDNIKYDQKTGQVKAVNRFGF